jgi:hypothetical protein
MVGGVTLEDLHVERLAQSSIAVLVQPSPTEQACCMRSPCDRALLKAKGVSALMQS